METVNELLGNIEGQMNNVETIRKRLFKVYDLSPNVPTIPNFTGEIESPDTQLVYNSNGKFLGHVGGIYESIQPETFLDSVVGTIEGCEGINLDLSQMTYRELKEGKIVNFRVPLGEIRIINILGHEDVSEAALSFQTGFGGIEKTSLFLEFYRMICKNKMKGWATEMALSVKHTTKMNQKILLYCAEVMKTISKVQETQTIWNEMNRKEVDQNTVTAFAEKIAGVTKDEKQTGKLSTRKANILNQVNEAIAQEFTRTGATVWGLLNGATNYTNHFASGSQDEDYILVNTGAKINELAQREAIALLN